MVDLYKRPGEGFGFVVITHEGKSEPKQYTHKLGEIIENPPSPAYKSGKLRVNDTITSVNGIRLEALCHQDVVILIKEAGSTVTLGIAKSGVGSVGSSLDMDRHFAVEINRGVNGSFGFGLRGGSEYGMKLYILRLAQGKC